MHINSILHFLENFYITTIGRSNKDYYHCSIFHRRKLKYGEIKQLFQYYEYLWELLKLCQCLLKHLPTLWNSTSLSIISEKAMAPHSSTLAWKLPWTEEPGRLRSTGSRRVGQDWATSLSLFTFMHWRRKWQPTPEFLPGESQGRRSLVGCCLWGRTESDMTEAT